MSNAPIPNDPGSNDPYLPPHTAGGPPPMQTGEDATGGVIPYNNPFALAAYYLGPFSMLPCVGLLLAIPALICGIMGLQKRKQNPAIKGAVHAWIGIVMGGIFTVVWGGVTLLMIIAAAAGN